MNPMIGCPAQTRDPWVTGEVQGEAKSAGNASATRVRAWRACAELVQREDAETRRPDEPETWRGTTDRVW